MDSSSAPREKVFTRYQVFMIAILAILQFTIVLDFMVLSPLSAILIPELNITPFEFTLVVSAYAFSAGASGLLAAGFADKFDRKKLLLFFYTGFVIGTLLCGIAPGYNFLLMARIVTGIFGGVIGSISFAIIADLFTMEKRGRVMGFVQMAFGTAQALGLPIGLYLATEWHWHAPFIMIVSMSTLVGIAIIVYMKPVADHLKLKSERTALEHLIKTVSQPRYLKAFGATTLLATGGFMLMPLGAAFGVNNLGLSLKEIPLLYLISGIVGMITGPVVGRISDQVGKYKIFVMGTVLGIVMVVVYCNLGLTPFWLVALLNAILFIGISSRMISASALMTGVPDIKDRGAFMGINSSVQQISGGIAAAIAGLIVVKTPSGILEHYDVLGYVVAGTMVLTVGMMYYINQVVKAKTSVGPGGVI